MFVCFLMFGKLELRRISVNSMHCKLTLCFNVCFFINILDVVFSVQFPVFPNKIVFFCEIAPPEGEQTAIVLSHKITQRMEQRYPQLVKKMEKDGFIYPYSLSQEDDPQSYLKGWQSHFQTKDKQEAERK